MTEELAENSTKKTELELQGGTEEANNDNNENNDSSEIEEVVELPHDILAGYFLVQQKGKWDEYSIIGKIGVSISIILPYVIQIYAGIILFINAKWQSIFSEYSTIKGQSLFENLLALSVLFIYMLRDLSSLYLSLFRYVRYIENQALKGIDITKLGI